MTSQTIRRVGSAAIERRRAKINAEIAALGLPLPGSLVQRRTRCGNTGCHCHGDPPQLHGPYLIWTRKVDNKTVTRTLDTTQADALRPLMENSRRLRELTTELATLALQQVRDDPTPDWPIRARSNLPSLFLRGPLLPFGGLGDGPHLGYDVLAERRALAGVERSDWACELTHHRVAVVAKPHGRARRATSRGRTARSSRR